MKNWRLGVSMEDIFFEPKQSVKDIVGSLKSNYEDV